MHEIDITLVFESVTVVKVSDVYVKLLTLGCPCKLLISDRNSSIAQCNYRLINASHSNCDI